LLANLRHNSRILAQSLQLSPDYPESPSEDLISHIGDAATLCNLGYLWVDDDEGHCERGAGILETLLDGESSREFKDMALAVVRHHHDDYSENLPMAARIVRITNDFTHSVERLRTEGVGEEALRGKAFAAIANGSGKAYDPAMVEILLKIQRQLHID
jgi:putative two-component system response regulator